ncbi:MAG: ABC transporter ATP-binding protein [Clostridia bacterium]|nr:ABC transporter ATP-binding protein [Clostridia bacterium]
MAFLKMAGIHKAFPGVIANDNVSLEVNQGEILALLGENGAGKTTLMNILYGLYHADKGDIYLEGKKVAFASPKSAIKAGIGMVHQHFMLVQTLTVLQNIILGLKPKGYPFIDYKKISKQIKEISNKYGLAVDVNQKISELSVGEEQRVEILKSLYRDAKILIFDEPTAVLTPQETEEFFSILKRLKQEGHAIIIITHRMSEIMQVSDRVTILRDGKNVATLKTKATNPHELSLHMIGRELNHIQNNGVEEKDDLLLSIKSLTVKGKAENRLKNINLDIHKGEIIGIAGVDGNGQKEFCEVIAGIRKCHSGEVKFCGQSINQATVLERYNKGISYVPDDRHKDGLVLDLDVSQNLIMRSYRRSPFCKNIWINHQAIHQMAEDTVSAYKIKTPKITTSVKLMSGGNQQKVILARELYDNPELIVVSQPTRGLDIGATENVRELLLKMRNNNKSVLLVSADLDEILTLSDRIAVMFDGEIVGVLKNDENLDMQELGALMAGHVKEGAAPCKEKQLAKLQEIS